MALPDLTNQFVADSFAGILHTANVPVTETNLPQVYDGLGNKTSLKLGAENGGASFSGVLSADGFSIGGYSNIINYLYPVGAIYLDTADINPQVRFTGTTWVRISEGRFLAGVGTGLDKNSVTGTFVAGVDSLSGEYVHPLTVSELPSHNHPLTHPDTGEQFFVINDSNFAGGGSNTFRDDGPDNNNDARYWSQIGNTGGNTPHNNIPPYFGIYIWKRLT